jgi:transcription elongation factor GreA
MGKPVYFTKEGLKKLQDELEYLVNVERARISQQIAEARDKGDLSENAEYDAAKEAQAMLGLRIAKLQNAVGNARIIDESQISNEEVRLFTIVTVKNKTAKKDFTYTIVSENETDIKTRKISINSPIGTGLLGKKVGDTVTIDVPAGKIELEILSIEAMQL